MSRSNALWVERAVVSLLLLPLAIAEQHPFATTSGNPVPPSSSSPRSATSASRRLHGRRYETLSQRHRAQREATPLSSNLRRANSYAQAKEDPDLPEYSWKHVVNESTESRYSSHDRTKRATPLDEEPHVTEPSDDIDSVWSRHAAFQDDNGVSTTDEEELEEPPEEEHHEEKLSHSPVVYQYFGRNRSRVHTADSIPFILLGPNVDHFKTVGQMLASRGFSVMACEVADEERHGGGGDDKTRTTSEEGKNLILAVLDALKWNRAILVGCDSEAARTIEAAIQLAPDRVAGLVLCGDLSSADKLAKKFSSGADTEQRNRSQRQHDRESHAALDTLLHNYLECPYTIVWDGDVGQSPTPRIDSSTYSADMFKFNRCQILGGGTAPHRRVPENFAWALTRFVEEKVAPRSVPLTLKSAQQDEESRRHSVWRDSLPSDLFSPGSFLVAGRLFASVIFYITAMKIAVYQYDNLRGGVVGFHSLVQCLRSGRQRIFHSAASFVRNYGYVFQLFGRIRPSKENAFSTENDFIFNQASGEGEVENEKELVEEEEQREGATEIEVEEGGTSSNGDDKEEDQDNPDLNEEEAETEESVPEEEERQRFMLLDLVVV